MSKDPKRTQMSAQVTIPGKTLNHNRWIRETKILHDKTKFKEYLSTNPVLQRILEGKLQPKQGYYTQENRKN